MSLLIAPPSRPVYLPTLTLVSSAALSANQTNYSGGAFDGMSFGPAARRRGLILGTCGRSTASRSVSSATIGGVAASLIGRTEFVGGGNSVHVELWLARVDSATSGNVVVNWSAGMNNCGVALFALSEPKSFSAFDSDDAVGDTVAAQINFANRGVGLAFSCILLGSASCTWTGASEVLDEPVETGNNTYFSAAIYTATVPETNRNISPNWTGSQDEVATFAASFA